MIWGEVIVPFKRCLWQRKYCDPSNTEVIQCIVVSQFTRAYMHNYNAKSYCIRDQLRARSTLQNLLVLLLVRSTRKLYLIVCLPMPGKPGIDVAVLTEECFVRLTLGLLRRGNKRLAYTTRGLYQPSYRGLAGRGGGNKSCYLCLV